MIPSALITLPYDNITESLYANFSLSQINNHVDSTSESTRITLDYIAPLKKKVIKKSHISTDPCISIALSMIDLMSFFNDKTLYLPPSTGTDLSSNIGTLETALKPDIY